MELITEQPLWYLIFCLILGSVCAFLLYRKDKLFADVAPWIKRTMAALRFLTISLLSFLLLSPLIKIILNEIEKPIIIVAQDNSESVLIGKNASYYKNEYPLQLKKLIKELETKYEVKTLSFGDKITEEINPDYTEKQTNISALFGEIYNRYTNRNVGAVILASDGMYNQGSNPLYAAENLKTPIFTIALGDTNVRKDLILKKVNHNKIAYYGNMFPLEVTIDAWQCKGSSAVLSILQDSVVLFNKTINVGNNTFHTIVPLSIEAKKKGMQHYKVQLSVIEGEESNTNNTKDIYIDILESKQKVLLLANAAHPDIAAIKQCIESNQSYEVKVALPDKFDGTIKNYNLVILHQLPSKNNSIPILLTKIREAKISVLYVLGNQSALPLFNTLETGVTITDNLQSKTNDVLPLVSNDFSLFTLSDELRTNVGFYPPLISPFGSYKLNSNGYLLLKQQIGSVKTEHPLLLFNDNGGYKTGVLAGEGIWKWRLRNYAEKNNHDAINELITKTVQYLSVKENKNHFRIAGKNNFMENEPVVLDAEVFNESYELVNTSEVKIKITNKDKKTFPYTFTKTDKAYTLNAGYLPIGTYSYQATATAPGKSYSTNGIFSISPLQIESSETMADHHLLYGLAKKFNGQMVFPNELEKLSKILNEREDIKPVSYSQKKLKEIINSKLLFFLILFMLSAEWFFRKHNGGY